MRDRHPDSVTFHGPRRRLPLLALAAAVVIATPGWSPALAGAPHHHETAPSTSPASASNPGAAWSPSTADTVPGSPASPPVPAAVASATFDSLKKLAGKWVGKSTKGWEEQITLKVIAGGSVLIENSFEAHPGEEMLTAWYLDGSELQLRHFCIAGNQPRLSATSVSPDGKEIVFTFLDATNLPTRDKGHMDKALYRLAGADSFSAQWTWYQDGRESWMEEVQYRRLP